MIRLFLDSDLRSSNSVALSPEQVHYLFHVMRRQVGDSLLVFNGRDGEWQAMISCLDKKKGNLTLTRQSRAQSPARSLILCPALIKKEPFDFVLQKATELGVSDIYPLITERTVVNRLNIERANTILTEASEQSERLTVPTLHAPAPLTEVLSHLPKGTVPVCLAERGQTTYPLTPDKTYVFFVGPEGGWTPAELDLFQQKGALFWHLGDTILRAETASLAALACYQFCISPKG